MIFLDADLNVFLVETLKFDSLRLKNQVWQL